MTPEQTLKLAKLCGYEDAIEWENGDIFYNLRFAKDANILIDYIIFNPLSPDTCLALMKKFEMNVYCRNRSATAHGFTEDGEEDLGTSYAPTPEEAVALCALAIEEEG